MLSNPTGPQSPPNESNNARGECRKPSSRGGYIESSNRDDCETREMDSRRSLDGSSMSSVDVFVHINFPIRTVHCAASHLPGSGTPLLSTIDHRPSTRSPSSTYFPISSTSCSRSERKQRSVCGQGQIEHSERFRVNRRMRAMARPMS